MKQGLELKQTQKLSPIQIQTIKLIELPVQELEQKVREVIESNPVLDETTPAEGDQSEVSIEDLKEQEDIPSYRLKVRNWGPDRKPEYNTFSVHDSFLQNLQDQLGCRDLNSRQQEIGNFLIGSLDDDGYLRRDIESIVDDLAFRNGLEVSAEEVLEILYIIQEFEPAGVGARDLQECLLLQLKSMKQTEDVADAINILSEEFQRFSARQYSKVQSSLGLSEERLRAAIGRIVKLNPAPGGQGGDDFEEKSQQIVPDFILEENDGELSFSMPRSSIPELRINSRYAEMLLNAKGQSDKVQKETATFVKEKIDSAKWFIEAIKQRQNTLRKTMQAILDYQREFFLSGDEKDIVPMVLKDIAGVTGYDISTISRVVNSKFIETPYGIFPLKFFFSEGIENGEGEEVSTRELKRAMQECVDAEDKSKPLTDEQLVAEMEKRGYKLARRTIAKYRSQLGIPLARWRKEI